jgi:DNA invertase Pin-like site-specific DNA recombinase
LKPKCFSYTRFSTPDQEKGDYLRRQIEKAEEWAQEHGLVLDDSLTDKGLSAYRGTHKTKGALGEFLKVVESGKIPKGSVLVVEAMDRLSREEVLNALSQFTSIIKAGIRIVTLIDNKEFTQESVNQNPFDLMYSINAMASAHGESERKSKRLKEAWTTKRNNVGDKKLTARSPAWLILNEDGTKFQVVKGNAKIIQRIFKMKAQGFGSERIARTLNEDKTLVWEPPERKDGKPSKRPWKGWRKSYVDKILRNPQVIGEYQPHRIEIKDQKKYRVPIGDPLPGYYPAVVKPSLFWEVQAKIKGNVGKGGRNGIVSNLFGTMAFCAYCRSPMRFVNKGKWQYLVCDGALRKNKVCVRVPLSYPTVEAELLQYVKGLNVKDLLPNGKERQSRIDDLQSSLDGKKGELAEITRKIGNLEDSIADTDNKSVRKRYEKKLIDLDKQASGTKKDIDRIQNELSKAMRSSEDVAENLKSISELMEHMDKIPNHQKAELRLRLREKLRGLMARIFVWPGGPFSALEKNTLDKSKRFYAMIFRTGSQLVVQPESGKVFLDIDIGKRQISFDTKDPEKQKAYLTGLLEILEK